MLRKSCAEKKQAVVRELEPQGIIFEALQDEMGQDFDAFDLIFVMLPLTSPRQAAKNAQSG
ncbi:MAG: hypothetical protein ACRCYY_13840 [Trueperaceae bacterium]